MVDDIVDVMVGAIVGGIAGPVVGGVVCCCIRRLYREVIEQISVRRRGFLSTAMTSFCSVLTENSDFH
jgi:hypothetical protein